MEMHLALLLLSALLFAAISTMAHSDALSSTTQAVPADAASKLAAEWWQWVESVPAGKSPIQDETGADCAQDQKGPVWFLAGGYGSSKIHRVCTVPEGRSLFFPIINMVYFPDQRSASSGYNCQYAQISSALDNDTAIDLFASIDGVDLGDLKRFRVSTPDCFDIFARLPKDQRPPYSGYPSATDGYWLLLKPLSKGHHVIKFGGKYNNSSPDYGHMIQDIEYDLVIE